MKQSRIDHFNHWPQAQDFDAELKFKSRLEGFELKDLFIPYQLPNSNNNDFHVCVSYFLDALDNLPLRPDHAFDWVWRGFEYLATKAMGGQSQITSGIRLTVCPTIDTLFSTEADLSNSFFELANQIPFQTCEYLLKRINEFSPFVYTLGQDRFLSSYSKRMLFANGNPPVVSQSLQNALNFLSTNYDLKNNKDRRKGASLLRRIIRRELVTLGSFVVQLNESEVLFFLISGLGYAFRNDRAHAESIAPFRSSTASLKTYAHCWFMFLLFYEVTFLLLHTPNSPVVLSGPIADNFRANNVAFIRLFGDHLNA